MNNITNWMFVLIVSSLLTACGGGGGGGDGGSTTAPATNTSPTVNAGTNASYVEGSVIELIGSASDSDGSIATYLWEQVSGDNVSLVGSTTSTVSFIAPQVSTESSLVFMLTVTDNDGASSSDEVIIYITNTGSGGIVDAGPDATYVEGSVVQLIGSASDASGTISSYLWEQVSGENVSLLGSTTSTASFTAPLVSTEISLIFRLTVTDNGGTSSSDEIIIKITNTDGSNNAPVVTLGADYNMFDGEDTSVTAKVTDSDELDDIASLQWSQVDNSGLVLPLNNATTLTVSFIAPNVSSDTVVTLRLTATDSRGSSGYSDISITIKDGSLSSGILNDTGVTACSDGANNGLLCPVSDYPRQDAEYGRDYWYAMGYITKEGSGNAGFDLTKMDAQGNNIAVTSSSWSCVRDNVTGLLWEAKQIAGTGDLHDATNKYTWYDTSSTTNAGEEGETNAEGDENCPGYESGRSSSYCNTKNQIKKVNAEAYCGITTWRLPTIKELQSIADYSKSSPSIDTDFFKHTSNVDYWSGTSNSVAPSNAFTINFFNASQRSNTKSKAYSLRLVAGN